MDPLDPRVHVSGQRLFVSGFEGRVRFDGIVRGLPSVLSAAFRRDENGAGPRISADTFVELGDGVLVAGRFFCGAGEEPFLHECSVRAGTIERIREYPV